MLQKSAERNLFLIVQTSSSPLVAFDAKLKLLQLLLSQASNTTDTIALLSSTRLQ